jgi:hypothetical protein
LRAVVEGARTHLEGLLSPSGAFARLSVKGALATLLVGIGLQVFSIWAVAAARPAFLATTVERQVEATLGVVDPVAVSAELRRRATVFSTARARRVFLDHILLWTSIFALVAVAATPHRAEVVVLGVCAGIFGAVLSALTPANSGSVWRDGMIGIAFGSALIALMAWRGPLAGVALRITAIGSVALTLGFVLRQLMTITLQRDPGHFTLAYFVDNPDWIRWLIRLDLFGVWWAVAVGAALAVYRPWKPPLAIAGAVAVAGALMLSGIHR